MEKQISSNQLGFKKGDSCIYQLLSIKHKIYQSFDNGFEVRRIFPKFGTMVLFSN